MRFSAALFVFLFPRNRFANYSWRRIDIKLMRSKSKEGVGVEGGGVADKQANQHQEVSLHRQLS